MTDPREMVAVIEAILFVATEPVPRAKLVETFGEEERPAAEAAVDAVLERYRAKESGGIVVEEVAGGLRLVTRADLHGHLRRFFEMTGSNKLSMAALETLAIIAYRQPITAPEIQELRGVSAAGVLRKLLERRLVRIAGRKEVVGKPFLYATTREFLMHFGLGSLKELPPLEQFEELFGPESDAAEAPSVDLAEDAARQAAALEQREDEEFQRQESDDIEAQRRAAEEEAEEEAQEEAEEGREAEEGVDPEPSPEPSSKKPAKSGESAQEAAVEAPSPLTQTPSGDGEEEP